MAVINRVVSEQIDIIPMQVRVLQHIRLVYGCKAGEHAPVTAELPPQPLPKSNAGPGLLSMLLTAKYVDGLPLARFEKVLARHDVTVPRHNQRLGYRFFDSLVEWLAACLTSTIKNIVTNQPITVVVRYNYTC